VLSVLAARRSLSIITRHARERVRTLTRALVEVTVTIFMPDHTMTILMMISANLDHTIARLPTHHRDFDKRTIIHRHHMSTHLWNRCSTEELILIFTTNLRAHYLRIPTAHGGV